MEGDCPRVVRRTLRGKAPTTGFREKPIWVGLTLGGGFDIHILSVLVPAGRTQNNGVQSRFKPGFGGPPESFPNEKRETAATFSGIFLL